MAQTIRQVMTADPVMVPAKTTLVDAARMMEESGIGDVLVERDGAVCGIVTDRDIVVRALAEGRDPKKTKVGDIASGEVITVSTEDTVDHAASVMRERAVRRLLVCDDGEPVGIVSLGDLAQEADPSSCLADISAAPSSA